MQGFIPRIRTADKHDIKLVFVHEFVANWWIEQVTILLVPLLEENSTHRKIDIRVRGRGGAKAVWMSTRVQD